MSTKTYSANPHSLSEARLRLGTALNTLYAEDWAESQRIWESYHKDYGKFFRDCMLGNAGFTPASNEVQKDLTDIPSRSINLYVGVFDTYEPSHFLTLVRGAEGLWQLQNPSIRPVNKVTKTGVLAVVQAHAYGGGVKEWIPLRMQESTV